MKKILSVILLLIMALSLVACEAPKKDNDSAPTNSKNEEAVSSEEEPTSSKEEVAKTEDDCVEESNKLLNDGKLKAALTVLYNGQNEFKGSQKIQAAINNFFKRVKFSFTANPGKCDAKSCFKDTRFPGEAGAPTYNMGINFVDSQTNKKETIAKINGPYDYLNETITDKSARMIKQNGDKILFEIFTGEGTWPTFIYNVKTNKLSMLACGLDAFVCQNGMLISREHTYGVDSSMLYGYNWDGKLVYKKESVFDYTVKNGWVHYATWNYDTDVYTVFKMKVNGTNNQELGTLEGNGDGGSHLSIEGDKIVFIYDTFTGETEEFSIYDLSPIL